MSDPKNYPDHDQRNYGGDPANPRVLSEAAIAASTPATKAVDAAVNAGIAADDRAERQAAARAADARANDPYAPPEPGANRGPDYPGPAVQVVAVKPVLKAAGVKEAADAIRGEINQNFSNLAHRDRGFVGGVLRELGLLDTEANRAQVVALLMAKNIQTHLEYPKAKYRDTEAGTVSKIVANKAEEDELGGDWGDAPPVADPASTARHSPRKPPANPPDMT